MNLPNLITVSRLVLTAIALTLVALHPQGARGSWWVDWWIFGLLFVAAVTDFVDGYIARRLGQTSLLGRILDPLADKVLICGSLVMFVELPDLHPWVPAWALTIVITREFVVQSLRGVAEATGKAFPADRFGKWKMGFQCVWVLGLAAWQAGWDWPIEVVRYAMWVALAFTVLSGFNYVRKARRVLEL